MIVLGFICFAGILSCAQSARPGSCPPALPLTDCSITCRSNTDCPTTKLCCNTVCGGTICIEPVTQRRFVNYVKPGNCPAVHKGVWVCSSTCTGDTDCPRKLKCCHNRCGAKVCTSPEAEPVPTIPTGFQNYPIPEYVAGNRYVPYVADNRNIPETNVGGDRNVPETNVAGNTNVPESNVAGNINVPENNLGSNAYIRGINGASNVNIPETNRGSNANVAGINETSNENVTGDVARNVNVAGTSFGNKENIEENNAARSSNVPVENVSENILASDTENRANNNNVENI